MRCSRFHILAITAALSILFSPLAAQAEYRHKTFLDDRFIHEPVTTRDCTVCHELHFPRGPAQTSKKVPDLCFGCHQDPSASKKVRHEPVKAGECLSCHYPHSAGYRGLLRVASPDLCLRCHADRKEGRHGDLRFKGDCLQCHDAHASGSSALLKPVSTGQCRTCHINVLAANIRHTALDEYDCIDCHNPHASPPEPVLACQECHEEQASGAGIHPAVEEGCTTCHDAHGSDLENQLIEGLPELCLECHPEQEKGRHHKVVMGEQCDRCHDPHTSDKPSLLTFSRHEASCDACHKAQTEGAVLHSALEGSDCGDCHNPHADPPEETVSCLDCHDSLLRGENRHEVAEEDCTTCHYTHSGPLRSLLRAGIPDLCLDCHDDKEDGRHGEILLDTRCSGCHDPHSSPRKKLLKVTSGRSCTDCHDDKAAHPYTHTALELNPCQHCHNPHVDPPVMPPLGCRTCHLGVADGNAAHSGASVGRCLECHDPHGSETPSLLRAEGSRPSDDCVACHRDIGRALENLPYRHEPVDREGCPDCHTGHVGSPPYLQAPFDTDKNVPYDAKAYTLCFECHQTALVETRTTDEETGFRDGHRNLHNLHVVRDGEKGYSCWVCHDPHASGQPHLITREVPLTTAYSLSIRYLSTERGGRCQTNCHTVKEYSR